MKQLVLLSSFTEYGEGNSLGISEDCFRRIYVDYSPTGEILPIGSGHSWNITKYRKLEMLKVLKCKEE